MSNANCACRTTLALIAELSGGLSWHGCKPELLHSVSAAWCNVCSEEITVAGHPPFGHFSSNMNSGFSHFFKASTNSAFALSARCTGSAAPRSDHYLRLHHFYCRLSPHLGTLPNSLRHSKSLNHCSKINCSWLSCTHNSQKVALFCWLCTCHCVHFHFLWNFPLPGTKFNSSREERHLFYLFLPKPFIGQTKNVDLCWGNAIQKNWA